MYTRRWQRFLTALRHFPTKEVSREEAAKIIAYLMVGSSSEADALSTTADPFEDVSKDRWSAGYIAYLVQKGVINGVGEGKFDPTGKVTGLQFAKMLLTALGYGVNSEYVGETWAINVAKDALQYGIFTDNLGGANNTPATREECALYAFNTLWLQKVTYSALLGGYIENIGYGNWYGGDPNNAESNKTDTFANDFGLRATGVDSDAFYRPVGYEYKVGKKVITATYGADQYLEASYTTPVTGNEMYNLLGRSLINSLTSSDKYELAVYVDGVYTPVSDEWIAENFVKSNTDKLERTGYGVETYIYVLPSEYTDDAKSVSNTKTQVRICIVDTLLAKVTDVVEENSRRDAKTTVETGTIEGSHLSVLSKTELTYATEEFKEGDLVLVTVSGKDGIAHPEVVTMVAATLKEGEITKYTNKKSVPQITANGDTYYGAEDDFVITGTRASKIDADTVVGEVYTLILDQYGYVIGITQEITPNVYVYVAQFGQKIDTSSSLSDKTGLSALIYYVDSESKTGASSKVQLVDINNSDLGAFDPKSFDTNYKNIIKTLNENNIGLYRYEESKGKAQLTRTSENGKHFIGLESNGFEVNKGISRLNKMNYTSTSTVFFYVTGKYGEDGFSVSAYTGINKVPTVGKDIKENTAIEGWAKNEYVANGTNFYEAMLVDYEPTVSTVTSAVYFYLGTYTKERVSDGYHVTLDVMKNGEQTTLEFTTSTSGYADDIITAAKKCVNQYIVLTQDGSSVEVYKTTKTDYYMDKNDGELIVTEAYLTDEADVYMTTLFVDHRDEEGNVTEREYYLENANIIDLREYDKYNPVIEKMSMNRLAKLTEDYDVLVAYEFNKYDEVTTLYILDVTPKA